MDATRIRAALVAAPSTGALVGALAVAGWAAPTMQRPMVTVSPPVVRMHEAASVAIRGLAGQVGVEVRLLGATAPSGRLLPWEPLRLENGAWRGRLPEPALRGIYPIELRTTKRAQVLAGGRRFLRVFDNGTLARPAFPAPAQVARWWVGAVAHATLTAIRPWRLPADDERDPRLHRLFVVAYSPPGDANPDDRRGIWITSVRDGYHGSWRLLEATVLP